MADESRIVLFGYHDVGAACLDLLLERGEQVVAVFTHRDDPGERQWFRSVDALARAAGIPVYAPEDPNQPEWVDRVRSARPDLLLSCYYRRMLGPDLLALPRRGAFNMHGSLLPRYRGRAPVNWAIVNGETQTGVTLHGMVRSPDAGPIVDQEPVPIGPADTALAVFGRITGAAKRVLGRSLDGLKSGRAVMRPQDEAQASYYGRRTPEDGRIDWTLPSTRIFNLVRAVTHPYPGAFTTVNGRKLYIWWAAPCEGQGRCGEVLSLRPLRVAAGSGALELMRIQWEGEPEAAGHELSGFALGLLCGD
ncbi:MAG: formyltransferase [Acidiferrobacteraceae bacterium]